MIEIIPAIDLIDGKCVRLSQGDFSRPKFYSENPLEVAKNFESIGVRRLHIVDLDGAKNGKISNLEILRSIAENTKLVIDFGGGIKTSEDIETVFDAGANIANVGSAAVKTSERFFEWIEEYGSDKILLGADVKNGMLAIEGWQTTTNLRIQPFLENCFVNGVRQIFVTDIAKDGLLQGASIKLYEQILADFSGIKLVASGGVSSIGDVLELENIGCSGVIIGKAIYEEGKIDLELLINRQIKKPAAA